MGDTAAMLARTRKIRNVILGSFSDITDEEQQIVSIVSVQCDIF